MIDHPGTIDAEGTKSQGIEWNDHATIHSKGDGQGVFGALSALHRGTLAEMVARIANMPAGERAGFAIQKAGDRRLDTAEILKLAARPDFPG